MAGTRIEGAAIGPIKGIISDGEAFFGVQEGNVIPPIVLCFSTSVPPIR